MLGQGLLQPLGDVAGGGVALVLHLEDIRQCVIFASFQKSGALIWIPNSSALIIRTPQRGPPIYVADGNMHQQFDGHQGARNHQEHMSVRTKTVTCASLEAYYAAYFAPIIAS